MLLPLFPLLSGILATSYDVDFSRMGATFDGVGAVSGGGATSKLLYSVNSTIRRAVLKTLFESPGGVQILKVELGGDDQSTEGTEASHWPDPDVFDWNRGYEWRLVKEALQINPKLKLCILPWTFPYWVGNLNEDPANATKYVVSWIQETYKRLKVKTYCVGLWNERQWSEKYVVSLRRALLDLPFDVKIVVSDNGKSEGDFKRMLAPNFSPFVDIIGVHYPGGILPEVVRTSGKTLWSTEDYSTFVGGFGCMARTLNWNYVYGNMTATLVWHLASAFYDSLPYYGAGLMKALPPDYLSYMPTEAFQAYWHTSAFTSPGWRFLAHGFGSGKLDGGGTFVSYSNGKQLTIVIETMAWKDSKCIYANPPAFTVAEMQNITFTLKARHRISSMYRIEGDKVQKVKVSNGTIRLEVRKNSLLTLTSIPPSSPPKPTGRQCGNCVGDYFDDYSDYENGEEARWLSPQKGTWLVFNGTLVQTVRKPPVSWCGEKNTYAPVAIMPGSSVSVDVRRPSASSPYPFIGIRTNCSGCDLVSCSGLFVGINYRQGIIFSNFSSWEPLVTFDLDEEFKEGNWKHFMVKLTSTNNVLVTFGSTTRAFPKLPLRPNGLIAVGSNGYGETHWDNLFVESAFSG